MRTDHWLLSCIVALGCGSPAAEPSPPSTGAAGVGGSAAAGESGMLGSAGSIGGAGSGSVGGAGTAAQAGAGNSAGLTGLAGTGGAGGTSGAAGMGGAGGGDSTSFQCSQLMGPNVAGEWFDAGFEAAVGSAGWQVKAPHHSFVDDWAKPDHDVWREQDCQGTYTECETRSRCENAAAVDRLLFVTQTGDYLGTSQASWQALINSAIATAKAKYPGLQRIELLTFVRGPAGKDCGGETTVSAQLDAAQQAIAAASLGFVAVGPQLTASSCELFSGAPHMTSAGNQQIAQALAAFYGKP